MAVQTQTVVSGVDGALAFAALNSGPIPQGKFQSYSLGVGQVINNISGFDSGGWQEFLGGIKGSDWSAVMSNKFNGANANPFGSSTAVDILPYSGATATFTIAAGCTWLQKAIIARHGIVQDVNGASVSALNGPCSGAPTIVWDET
jgi:hypothetical protein